jgi:hypothetical protein
MDAPVRAAVNGSVTAEAARAPYDGRWSASPAGAGDGVAAGGSGVASSSRLVTSTPLMPSTRQWWVLVTSAQRPPARPCTRASSHSGRERSSRCAQKSPSQSWSSRSPPGAGSIARCTWSATSKRSSGTQDGRVSPPVRGDESRARKRGSAARRAPSCSHTRSTLGAPPRGRGSNTIAQPMCMCDASSCSSISRNDASRVDSRSGMRQASALSGGGTSAHHPEPAR